MTNFTTTGKLIYDPNRKGMKKNTLGWCVVKTNEDICRYYRWWVWRRYGITLNNPSWGSHVSVIRGEGAHKHPAWKKYNGEIITLQYSHNVRRAGDTTGDLKPYWFVDVHSDRLNEIREELGLPNWFRNASIKYHMTIGRTHE